MKDIIIIGAGLTGLTTSYYLKKNKKNILVLEKQNRTGGVINTKNEKGFLYEEGPNSGIIGSTETVELFENLQDSLELELAEKEAKKRYVLKKSKWQALPGGPISAIFTPLFTLYDKLNLLLEPARKVGTNPNESLAKLVKRRMGKSFLNYAIDPFVLGIYSGDPAKLTTKYAFPKLYNLEQNYGSFIGGAFKKSKETKSESEKKVNRKIFSFKGGLTSLIDVLSNKIGKENINCGIENLKISKLEDGTYKASYKLNNELITVNAKNIIYTGSGKDIKGIFNFIDSSLIENISSVNHSKVLHITLGYDNWNSFNLDGFGGLIPFIENRNILGALFMSTVFKNRANKKGALFSLFVGGVRREELTLLEDKEIFKLIEKEMFELFKCKQKANLFKIHRYDNAIPQYGPETGKRIKTIEDIKSSHKGLFIGGNAIDGIGISDRIKQGRRFSNSSFVK